MSCKSATEPPAIYEIRIRGHLDSRWAVWFEGLTITLEANGDTLLSGPVVDQSALHGLLKQVRDLGLPLVSVSAIEPGQENKSRVRSSTGVGSVSSPKSITRRRRE